MPSQADELAERVRRFAVRVVRFVRTLPRDPAIDAIGRQLAKSATSESASYGSSRRARSRAEFVAKIGTVAEEADESEHWLNLLAEALLASGPEFEWLLNDSRELRDPQILRSSNPHILSGEHLRNRRHLNLVGGDVQLAFADERVLGEESGRLLTIVANRRRRVGDERLSQAHGVASDAHD